MSKKNNHSPVSPYYIPSVHPSARAVAVPVATPLNKIIPIQKIIRLSQVELASKVEEAINENPFLERILPEEGPSSSVAGGDVVRPIEGADYFTGHSQMIGLDDKNILEAVNPNRDLSLTGDLLQQLDWLELSPADYQVAQVVISLIGERGYIDPHEAEKVFNELDVSKNDFIRVWDFLKNHLDPPGVTCEGVEDSLAVQLLRKGFSESDLSVKMVRNYFSQLSKKQYAAISKEIGVTTKEVKAAARVIHALDPYPLRNRDDGEFDNSIIVPDVWIRYREGRLEVNVNQEMVPQIRLLKDVVAQALKKKSSDDEAKSYLREKKNEAEILVQALSYRESNLKRVIDYLLERQRDFFIEGFSHLRPCKMSDVSEALGIDKGSLSRLVNNKYVATDWGTFLLREMFSLPLEINGEQVSPKVIEEKIKSLIKEFPNHKLTDQKIAMILKKMGYPIARRTVNKYRKRIERVQ